MTIGKSTIERPFRFGPKGIVIATGLQAREARIMGALGIQATTPGFGVGELAWDLARGARMDALRNASTSSAFEDVVIRVVEDAFDYTLQDERLDAVGGELTDEILSINIECVPRSELGNTQRRVAKKKLNVRRRP